jgi:multiple sugar transport system permease protein
MEPASLGFQGCRISSLFHRKHMKQQHRSKLEEASRKDLMVFLSLWVLSLVVFWYGPILYTFILGFTKHRLGGGGSFIGFGNYVKIFHDPYFWNGLKTTFLFTVLYVPLNFVIGLFTAYLMRMKIRLKGLWRTLIYLPSVLPTIAVLVLGKFVFYPNGIVNTFLEFLHIPCPLWIANPHLIIITSVLLMVWQCGTGMVVYLGALQGVPDTYYEAARIDGLSSFRQFFVITIPMISPTIQFRFIMDFIFGVMIFIPALILPEGGVAGGPGVSSRFFALHIYEKAFQRFQIGEGYSLFVVGKRGPRRRDWMVCYTFSTT